MFLVTMEEFTTLPRHHLSVQLSSKNVFGNAAIEKYPNVLVKKNHILRLHSSGKATLTVD